MWESPLPPSWWKKTETLEANKRNNVGSALWCFKTWRRNLVGVLFYKWWKRRKKKREALHCFRAISLKHQAPAIDSARRMPKRSPRSATSDENVSNLSNNRKKLRLQQQFNELIKSIGLGWAWTFVDFLNLATSASAKGDGTTSRPRFFF